MAFVPEFACGFEMGVVPYRAGRVGLSAGSSSFQISAAAHTGNYCLRTSQIRLSIWRAAPSATLDLAVWAAPERTDGRDRFGVRGSGTYSVELRHSTTWDLYVGGVLAAAGSVETAPATWQHVQVHIEIHGATGVVQTIVDGVPDIDYSGDTQGAAGPLIDEVTLGLYPLGTGYWDDLVFGEGGWPGDLRIDPLVVTGDDTVAWNPSGGGDNYADVDGIPPDAPYVYTDADARDLYTLADWDDTDGAGTVVKDPVAVTVWAQVRKEDASTDDQFRLLQSDGVNEANSGYVSILSSYEHHGFLRTAAPSGGLWSKAEIDALRVGIEADLV